MIPNRIVLDTNVCLDLFVFVDPRWKNLLTALQNGSVQAVTRADCRREWQIVLGYTQLGLDEAARLNCEQAFDALIRLIPQEELLPPSAVAVALPLCRDPDDQKFLELARDANASILITKDKALLKLARKSVRIGLFHIIKPEAWPLAA